MMIVLLLLACLFVCFFHFDFLFFISFSFLFFCCFTLFCVLNLIAVRFTKMSFCLYAYLRTNDITMKIETWEPKMKAVRHLNIATIFGCWFTLKTQQSWIIAVNKTYSSYEMLYNLFKYNSFVCVFGFEAQGFTFFYIFCWLCFSHVTATLVFFFFCYLYFQKFSFCILSTFGFFLSFTLVHRHHCWWRIVVCRNDSMEFMMREKG